MQFRREYKYYINYADYLVIRSRLNAVTRLDGHVSEKGYYNVRSLYFDTPYDKVLREKTDGLFDREKFRIRFYDFDLGFIRLEKKVKKGGLGYKLSAKLTEEETKLILRGSTEWMKDKNEPLLLEFYEKMKTERLRPRTVVDYIREPYIYPAGNVRITLDRDIRSGAWETDFLDRNIPTVPVCPGEYILEVKYDNFLPEIIKDIIQLKYREENAFSKYCACRSIG